MSVEVMALVFKFEIPALQTDDGKNVPDSTSKFVLLALADHASGDGENAYIGVRRIIAKTQLSASTVCNALNALRHNGYITLVGKSKADTNNYTINIARFQPVESGDSSQWNPDVSATRTKPLINHPSTKKSIKRPDFKSLSPEKYRTIPELKTFMDATGWIPGSFVLEVVYDFVSAGLTREQITAAFSEWTARGYKPANVKGYLTWARDGIPAAYSGNKQTKPAEPKAFEGIRQFMEGVNYGNAD